MKKRILDQLPKAKPTGTIMVRRVPPAVKQKLEAYATRMGVSMNTLLLAILKDAAE